MDVQCLCLVVGVVLHVLVVGCSGGEPMGCPEKCTCTVAIDQVTCKDIDYIPMFKGRDKVRSLNITDHSIAFIKLGDFVNFTSLSQLRLNRGHIQKLTNESFIEVRESLTVIDLSHNGIEVIEKTFVNFTKLKDLELKYNALTKLEAGTFVNMPSLNTLKFEHNSIAEVQPGAFKDLPNIEILNFYTNKLTEVPWNGFRGLNSLEEIDLRSNKISSVGEDTDVFLPMLGEVVIANNPLRSLVSFPNVSNSLKILNIGFTHIETVNVITWQNVPQLEKLYMDGIRLYEVTQDTFKGLSKLQNLYLTDMDHLVIIGPHAFAGLDDILTIDLSRNKKLSNIHEDAFGDTNVSTVYIADCAMESFPENLLNWKNMTSVQLYPNPINCDCHAKWMTNGSVFPSNQSGIASLKCASPKHLAGSKVVSLNPSYFICTTSDNHGSRFVTAVAVALVVATAMTTFALLFKFRHRISLYCRRYFQYRRFRNDMIFTVEHDTSVGELDDNEGRLLKDMRLETVPLEDSA